MAKNTVRGLSYCSYCNNGIGNQTYNSTAIVGQYCTSDCYVDAVMKELGIDGLFGKFTIKADGHRGVELALNTTIDKA